MSAVRVDVQSDSKKKSAYLRPSTASRINPQALLFDLYSCPARLPEAEMHYKATKFALPVADSQNLCPCCKQTCEVKEFSFFGNTNHVSQVSPTVSIYFYFLGFIFLMKFLIFMFNSVSLLVLAPSLRDCFITKCEADTTSLFAVFKESEIIRILAFVTLLLMICLRHIFYLYVKHMYIDSVSTRVSADDFSFMLHVPDYKTEEQIKEDVNAIIQRHHLNYTVVTVNKVYNLRKYIALMDVISKQSLMMRRMENEGKAETLPYRKCYDTKRFAVESLELLVAHLNTLEGEISHFANIAFVTFKSNYERMTLQKLLTKPMTLDRIKSRIYWAEQADEPENYLWENFGTKIERKIAMRALTVIATLACWAITFTVVTVFKYGASLTGGTPLEKIPVFIFNFCCYLIITAMHIVLGYFTSYLTDKEHFTRLPSKLASLAWKGFLVAFVNTAISIAVSSAINDSVTLAESVWTPSGMVPTMSLVLTFDIIYQHMSALFSFDSIKSYFRKQKLVGAVLANGESNKVMQADLNTAHECPEFAISGNYMAICYAFSMVCFYQQVSPFISLLGMGMTAIKFMVTRYLLIYRSRRPKNFDFEFTQQMFTMLDFCLLVYGASTAFFQKIFGADSSWYCTLMITIGAVNLLYGMMSVNARHVKAEGLGQELLFDEYSKKLVTDYDRSNPMTASRALSEWLAKIGVGNNDPKVQRAMRMSTAVRVNTGNPAALMGERQKPSLFGGEGLAPAKDPGSGARKPSQPSGYSAVRMEPTTPMSKAKPSKQQANDKTPGKKSNVKRRGNDDDDETPNLTRDVYYSSVP